jgi:hypothetical protein
MTDVEWIHMVQRRDLVNTAMNFHVFYSLITVKHNSHYNSKVYSQVIDIRQHVSARIGPSSGQKNVQ